VGPNSDESREVIGIVANKLLPVLMNTESSLGAIQFLNDRPCLPGHDSLTNYLDNWQAAAPSPHHAFIDEIKRTLAANKMRDGAHIRLTLTRGVKITSGMDPRLNQSGPTLIVLAEHKPPVYAKTGLSLITSKIRRPPPDVLDARIHHANLLNSILAKIEANNAGADDALMLDTRGFVAETNATHVFIVRNSESRTSGDLATGHVVACPEGITRATVIEICAAEKIRCVETDLSLVDVYGAHEMFCTGTMGELAGVIRIDNRQIGDGKVGAMTKRLSDLYVQRTASEGMQVVDL